MVKKKIRLFVLLIITLCLTLLSIMYLSGLTIAYAASPVDDSDGTYSVSLDIDLAMGGDNFSKTGKVEKQGSNYYFSFTQIGSSMTDLSLNSEGGSVGFIVQKEGNSTTYIYTLSKENLQKTLQFSCYVAAMKRTVSFTVKIDLANATKISDTIADLGERPAEFIPVITTNAGSEYEAAQGSVFPIPAATAELNGKTCETYFSAYYVRNGEIEDVNIDNGTITLSNVGEYHIIYRASHSAYKTSLGNDTWTEYDVTIKSMIGGGAIAKYNDTNGVLSDTVSILASRFTEGSSIFAIASEKMSKIADNFEVFGVRLISEDGSEVKPFESVTLYLQADSTYNRNDIEVYHLSDDGVLTKISCNGYGRYVQFDTDKTGTFIVCIPGVAFVMPMWGYAVICCFGGAIIIAVAVTIPIVVIKKRKKRKIQEMVTE